MRVLLDYDGTISSRGRISSWKLDMIKEMRKAKVSVAIYTSRKGKEARKVEEKMTRLLGFKIKVIEGREPYDFFVNGAAGDWDGLTRYLKRKKVLKAGE